MEFAKVRFIRLMNERLPAIFSLMRDKKLSGRDISVLLACLYFTNWKTGKCRVTTKKVSEVLGTSQANVRNSMRKLKSCNMIVDASDANGTSYMIPHPKIFECSNGKARGLLLKSYYSVVYGPDFEGCVEDEELEFLGANDLDSKLIPDGDDLIEPDWLDEF